MKTIKKIIKSTFIFGVFYIIEKLVISLFFYEILKDKLSLSEVIINIISNNASQIINNNLMLTLILAFGNLVELIGFSILTSYIFAYILNREPKILLPDKLIIRHSNSSDGVLVLGVMVKNKNRMNIFNVECTITGYYIKDEDPSLANADFKLKENQPLIKNYYRFSFPLKNFPAKLLEDMLVKNKVGYKEDAITVLLTGNANFLGSTFGITKKYHLSDIVYSEDIPKPYALIVNPFTGKKLLQYVSWKELENVTPMDEDKRNNAINEMKNIIAYNKNNITDYDEKIPYVVDDMKS